MKIYDEVLEMIERASPVFASGQITRASNLFTDLGLDSLEFVKLLLDIEEKYFITFELVEMEDCLQIDRLITLVEGKLEELKHDS